MNSISHEEKAGGNVNVDTIMATRLGRGSEVFTTTSPSLPKTREGFA